MESIKIKLDKYYTPVDLAKYCIDKTYEVIGKENITDIVEPSAGNGAFSNQLECVSYDIEPEYEGIIKQDYLTLDISYKKDRLIIGNPPYGRGNTLSVKFFKKSIRIADYIAFILPISQLNNNMQMYEFDLIYSIDLGLKVYTDRELQCVFNIYKRPIKGLNKKNNYKLKDIEIIENRRTHPKTSINYDIAMCSYGKGIIGREPQYIGQYVKEFYFKVHNDSLNKKIIELIRNTKWESICSGMTGQLNLAQWQVYKYIKEQIPNIQ